MKRRADFITDPTCNKCGEQRTRYSYGLRCLTCARNRHREKSISSRKGLREAYRTKTTILLNDIEAFIEPIDKRNGYASMNDVFVSLITLYNRTIDEIDDRGYKHPQLEHLDPKDQILLMWDRIRKVRELLRTRQFEKSIKNRSLQK